MKEIILLSILIFLFILIIYFDRRRWKKAYLYAVKYEGITDTLNERKKLQNEFPDI